MTGTPLRILQFGASGQLARELLRAAGPDIAITALPRAEADFTRPAEVAEAVRRAAAFDVAVNATAYTAVDKAESEEAVARLVNAESVGALAAACAARGVPFVHVSTDYVFDGEKPSPYVETDATAPLGAYGRTKLEGERQIRETLAAHAIIRTAWVYSAHGSNFVKTMLRLGAERDELKIVDDQTGAPTSAADLAGTVLTVARALAGGGTFHGTFHYSGGGATTWRRFAEHIFARAAGWAGIRARVVPISASAYPAPARRPRNSRLDCARIEAVYGIRQTPWTEALEPVLEELKTMRGAA